MASCTPQPGTCCNRKWRGSMGQRGSPASQIAAPGACLGSGSPSPAAAWRCCCWLAQFGYPWCLARANRGRPPSLAHRLPTARTACRVGRRSNSVPLKLPRSPTPSEPSPLPKATCMPVDRDRLDNKPSPVRRWLNDWLPQPRSLQPSKGQHCWLPLTPPAWISLLRRRFQRGRLSPRPLLTSAGRSQAEQQRSPWPKKLRCVSRHGPSGQTWS